MLRNIRFHFSAQVILNQREVKKYSGCHKVNYSTINYRFLSISKNS